MKKVLVSMTYLATLEFSDNTSNEDIENYINSNIIDDNNIGYLNDIEWEED